MRVFERWARYVAGHVLARQSERKREAVEGLFLMTATHVLKSGAVPTDFMRSYGFNAWARYVARALAERRRQRELGGEEWPYKSESEDEDALDERKRWHQDAQREYEKLLDEERRLEMERERELERFEEEERKRREEGYDSDGSVSSGTREQLRKLKDLESRVNRFTAGEDEFRR